MIRSLEHAYNELAENNLDTESQKLTEWIEKARISTQSSDFTTATRAIAEGLQIFSQAIQSSMLTDTDTKGSP